MFIGATGVVRAAWSESGLREQLFAHNLDPPPLAREGGRDPSPRAHMFIPPLAEPAPIIDSCSSEMPAAAKAKSSRQHGAKPYDRSTPTRGAPGSTSGGEGRRELRQSSGGQGLLGTPGRLISGALSWLSPWKAPGGDDEEDEETDEGEEEEEVEAGGGKDSESTAAGFGTLSSESDVGSSFKAAPPLFGAAVEEPTGMADPSLQAFAKTVGSKFPAPGSNDTLSGPIAARVPSSSSAMQTAAGATSNSSADEAQATSNRGGVASGGSTGSAIVRPRAVHSLDALAVARAVSRMGAANRSKKRQLAQKYAMVTSKTYTVLAHEATPLEGGEPSAFRVAVAKPRVPLQSIDNRNGTTPMSSTHRAGAGRYSFSGGVAGGNQSLMAASPISPYREHHNHSNFLDTSVTLNATNTSMTAVHSSSMMGSLQEGSFYEGGAGHRVSFLDDRRMSAKEFAERALAPLSSALAPMRKSPTLDMDGRDAQYRDSSVHRVDERFTPFESTPAPPRAPSEAVAASRKRARESYAPEPSPAPHRRTDSIGQPVQQKRRTSSMGAGKPSHTVKTILNIIQNTSTPSSDTRNIPSSRFFTSQSTYASNTTNNAEAHDSAASYSFGTSEVNSSTNAAASGSSYTFAEPETPQLTVQVKGRRFAQSQHLHHLPLLHFDCTQSCGLANTPACPCALSHVTVSYCNVLESVYIHILRDPSR